MLRVRHDCSVFSVLLIDFFDQRQNARMRFSLLDDAQERRRLKARMPLGKVSQTLERWRARRGTAAIEFALAAPLLATLVMGVVELGFDIYQEMQVQNAVEAGALYAAKNGSDSAGISAAVLSATGAANITASPAPLQFCGCPDANGINAATCGTACPGGASVGSYIRISASAARISILPSASFGLPATLTGQAVIRLQ